MNHKGLAGEGAVLKNICRTQKTDGFPGWRAAGLFIQNRKILERKKAQIYLINGVSKAEIWLNVQN